jgi:hypothetical protein
MSMPDDSAAVPRSVGQLERAVRVYAKAHGLTEKRMRDRIAYMAMGGVLEALWERDDGPHFALRGGVAMELRWEGAARATKDLDLTYDGPDSDLVRVIEAAITPSYGRFTFRRTGAILEMTNADTVRVEIGVRFDGAPWSTITIDISPREQHAFEIERVRAFDVTSIFGIAGPEYLPCMSARYHLAHKIHGMTATRQDGKPNDRAQDAIDVLLYRDIVADLIALREACVDVFNTRGRHAWPPVFAPPDSWSEPFARMAEELELGIRDLDTAIGVLREFIRAIDSARNFASHGLPGA